MAILLELGLFIRFFQSLTVNRCESRQIQSQALLLGVFTSELYHVGNPAPTSAAFVLVPPVLASLDTQDFR
jgi:hypothetical protein